MNEITILHPPIDMLRIEELNTILGKYKAGKARQDERVKSAENWWKMRNQFEEQKTTDPKTTASVLSLNGNTARLSRNRLPK